MFEVLNWFECMILNNPVTCCLSSPAMWSILQSPTTNRRRHSYTNVYAYNGSVTNENGDLCFFLTIYAYALSSGFTFCLPGLVQCSQNALLFQRRSKKIGGKKAGKCHKCFQAWLMTRDKAIFQLSPHLHSSLSGWVLRFSLRMLWLSCRKTWCQNIVRSPLNEKLLFSEV